MFKTWNYETTGRIVGEMFHFVGKQRSFGKNFCFLLQLFSDLHYYVLKPSKVLP
jgi:hypothetical protein